VVALNARSFATAFLVPQPERMFEPVEPQFATIEEYWRNPAPFDAERDANRATAHAHFDAHRDAALIAAGLIDAPARTQEPPKC
jgi:hypothetical protein